MLTVMTFLLVMITVNGMPMIATILPRVEFNNRGEAVRYHVTHLDTKTGIPSSKTIPLFEVFGVGDKARMLVLQEVVRIANYKAICQAHTFQMCHSGKESRECQFDEAYKGLRQVLTVPETKQH